MNNVILIGMPSCGKSTVGVLLAKKLRKNYIDTDILIQQSVNKSLFEILSTDGIETFKNIENDILSSLDLDNHVISTGGSAIYGKEAMENLSSTGIVIYIRISYEEMTKRINNLATRGIVMEKGFSLLDVYNERVPLYEKYADVIIDGDNSKIEDVVSAIASSYDREQNKK